MAFRETCVVGRVVDNGPKHRLQRFAPPPCDVWDDKIPGSTPKFLRPLLHEEMLIPMGRGFLQNFKCPEETVGFVRPWCSGQVFVRSQLPSQRRLDRPFSTERPAVPFSEPTPKLRESDKCSPFHSYSGPMIHGESTHRDRFAKLFLNWGSSSRAMRVAIDPPCTMPNPALGGKSVITTKTGKDGRNRPTEGAVRLQWLKAAVGGQNRETSRVNVVAMQ